METMNLILIVQLIVTDNEQLSSNTVAYVTMTSLYEYELQLAKYTFTLIKFIVEFTKQVVSLTLSASW